MITSRVTPPTEEEGAEVDGAEGVGGVANPDCLERSYASLHLTIAESMAHITWKWSDTGKGTEKWRKILMIGEGKMNLSQIFVSLCTSIMEKNEMGGKNYSKMLKQRKQKSSTGLGNRVIVRKRMQNKGHNHVEKSRAFRKFHTRGELIITPIRWTLTKRRYELVFGHNPQTIITGVVRIRYPRDVEHIGYNIWCDHNARTPNVSNKKGY